MSKHARVSKHRRPGRIVRTVAALAAMGAVVLGITSSAAQASTTGRHPIDSGRVIGQLEQVAMEISGHHFRTFTFVDCNLAEPGHPNMGCLLIKVSQSSFSMSWGNSSSVQTSGSSPLPNKTVPWWLHISNAFNAHGCHLPGHKTGRAVIVWQKHGNTSALHCAGPPLGNGKTFTS